MYEQNLKLVEWQPAFNFLNVVKSPNQDNFKTK